MKATVTDHALVRWLERVHGFDMEGFREQLAREVQPYIAVDARRVRVKGLEYRFEGGRLITVMIPGKPPKREERA